MAREPLLPMVQWRPLRIPTSPSWALPGCTLQDGHSVFLPHLPPHMAAIGFPHSWRLRGLCEFLPAALSLLASCLLPQALLYISRQRTIHKESSPSPISASPVGAPLPSQRNSKTQMGSQAHPPPSLHSIKPQQRQGKSGPVVRRSHRPTG